MIVCVGGHVASGHLEPRLSLKSTVQETLKGFESCQCSCLAEIGTRFGSPMQKEFCRLLFHEAALMAAESGSKNAPPLCLGTNLAKAVPETWLLEKELRTKHPSNGPHMCQKRLLPWGGLGSNSWAWMIPFLPVSTQLFLSETLEPNGR